MGLPLYVPPVESDVRPKIPSQPGTQARSRTRGTRTRSTEFLRETRRRAILAATTAVRNRRDALPQETPAAAHRSSQDRGDLDDQAWQHPVAEPYYMYGADSETARAYDAVIGQMRPDVQSYIPAAENPPAARSSTALPARNHFSRRRPLDRPLDAARYDRHAEQDADNLLALFSEHWAAVGPGADSLIGSADEGAPARSAGRGRHPAHRFGMDGFVDDGLSLFGTESDTDGHEASSRASRIRRQRSQQHTPSLPLGLTYTGNGRPTVGWSDHQERARSRSPVSSSRAYGNVSHIRGADVIYPEERTRHNPQTESYTNNPLNRAARRSVRTLRTSDFTTNAQVSDSYGTDAVALAIARAVASSGASGPGQPNLPPFRYIFGSPAAVDGLGDRQRSLSPEGDGVWDTLQTTVTPDPQPPSVNSSFASFPSGRTAAEHNAGHDEEHGGLMFTAVGPATRESVPGANEGDDDVTLTLDPPPVAQTRTTTDAAPDSARTRENAGGALPSGATSASTARSRRPVPAGVIRSLNALVGRPEANSGEDADCIEGSETDGRRRDERRTGPVRHGEMQTTRAPANEGADTGALGMSHGPRHPWQEDLATVIRSSDYALSRSLLGGRPGFNRPDDGMMRAVSPTPNESMGRARMSGMQHFVRDLAQQQDITDEWWAEVGLSRTLPED